MTALDYRPLTSEDFSIYLSWINQRAIWEVDNPGPYVRLRAGEVRPRFDAFVRSKRSFMMLLENRKIGYLGFKEIRLCAPEVNQPRHTEAEFFIIIGDVSAQNKGYGGEAMLWLLNKGFCDYGLWRIRARVLGNNARAIHLYDRLGFRYETTLGPYFTRRGERYGIHEYSLHKDDWLRRN